MRAGWLVLVVLTAGCAPSADRGDAASTEPSATQAVPSDEPSIRGLVMQRDGRRILVEENPADESGSPKAWVDLTEETRLLRRSGAVILRSDLETGRTVSVWFTGPVRESYPVQAVGGTVVLEPG